MSDNYYRAAKRQVTRVGGLKTPISHRRSKNWKRWLLLLAAALALFLLWYGITIVQAFRSATAGVNQTAHHQSVAKKITTTKDQPINFLLIGIGGGTHPGALLSDTIIVASLDLKANTLSLLSIPRDLYVNIPGHGYDKINAADSYGETGKLKGGGALLLEQTITKITGLPIDYYVRLDFQGFQKVIDTIGGITVTVDKPLNDPFYPDENTIGYDPFYISAGVHQMNGTVALKYARSRETTSDFDRSKRQQQILAATKDKLLSAGVLANPVKVTQVIQTLGSHIVTDLSVGDIATLVGQAKNMANLTIRSQVIDNTPETGLLKDSKATNGAYILVPRSGDSNFTDISRFAAAYFANPIVSKESSTLELVNGGVTTTQLAEVQKELVTAGFTLVTADGSMVSTASASPGTIASPSPRTKISPLLSPSALVVLNRSTKSQSLAWLKQTYGLASTAQTDPTTTANFRLTIGKDLFKATPTPKATTSATTILKLTPPTDAATSLPSY